MRLVSLGLLMACNSFVGQPDLERRATDWIRYCSLLCSLHQLFPAGGWLTARPTRSQKSYCEMLLLTAIHFHAGQLSAVADLVCQTTGIKMTVRTNGMARIKRITIITEIFTESVVAAHAIKVIVMRLWCLWSSYSNGPF